ncbi:MAG TPA: hypothetical protein V6D48_16510 [Oculatellaceae cyanobacterium]
MLILFLFFLFSDRTQRPSARRQKAEGRRHKKYCLHRKLFNLFQLDSYFRHAALVFILSGMRGYGILLRGYFSTENTIIVFYLSRVVFCIVEQPIRSIGGCTIRSSALFAEV